MDSEASVHVQSLTKGSHPVDLFMKKQCLATTILDMHHSSVIEWVLLCSLLLCKLENKSRKAPSGVKQKEE